MFEFKFELQFGSVEKQQKRNTNNLYYSKHTPLNFNEIESSINFLPTQPYLHCITINNIHTQTYTHTYFQKQQQKTLVQTLPTYQRTSLPPTLLLV